jgi:diguanylate cyclase (GGDEF)-like protein
VSVGRLQHIALALLGAACMGLQTPVVAAPAPMQFARLGGDSGLAAGGVMTILQDLQGFIWLGTEDGLDRYDGYELRHHVSDRSRSSSLPNNWVAALAAETDGSLWIGTDGGGLVRRNPATGGFDPLRPINGVRPVATQETVRVIHVDPAGVLWVGTRDGGLVMIDRRRQILRRFRHAAGDESSLSSDSVFAIIADHGGRLWIGTDGGLDRLDPQTGLVERQSLRSTRGALPTLHADSRVNALLEDRHGDLWIGTNSGLLRRAAGADVFTVYQSRAGDAQTLPGDGVQTLLEDDEQRVWVGTAAGLALYDREANRFDVYRHNPADAASLPDDNIIALFEDRGGLLWVGTKSGGAAIWNSRSWSFGHHAGGDGIGQRNVAGFAEDAAGTLWVAGLGTGLDAVDTQHGTTVRYRHDAANAASLPDDRVMALLADRHDHVWIGTMTGGLSRFDLKTRRFTTFRHDPNDPGTLGASGVMSLLEDSRGRIWAGTYGGGLSLFDAATQRFIRYRANPSDPATLSSDRATALAEDRYGRIWVGTDGGGLCLLDPGSGRVTRFVHDAQNPFSLGANTVYAIRVDEHGTVWVGTRGGGLDQVLGSALEPSRITFRNFSESDGLPNSTIYGIESDSSGALWLSTNRGLSRFDPRSLEVRNFRRTHGLQGDEFNFGSHYRSAKGELFFGGPNGYNAFIPERLRFDDRAPPVVLTAFLKLNEPARTALPPERLGAINLGYRDHIVTFEFAALDFASPSDNRYRYQLEGFDKAWVEAGTKHRVTYTNLAGGDYRFRVTAANSDGKWNDIGFSLALVMRPPPWATPWAYGGYAVAFMLLIFAVWNHQHKKLRREERYAHRLEQDVKDRTAELALRNDDLERVNGQLKEASLTDPLTGLGNRRYLCDGVAAVIREAASGGGPTLALLVVDLDHLKPINDAQGHESGDQILMQVAEILRSCCGSSDFIARWGGDEFVVVHRDQDLAAAAVLAELIRARVAKRIFRLADGKAARTSCSIGFSRYPFVLEEPGMLPWEQCLAVADAALYQAKKQRNGWVGWAGTAAAMKIPSIVRLLEKDPEGLERDGCLEVCRPSFRPDDTVNTLFTRRRTDSGADGR